MKIKHSIAFSSTMLTALMFLSGCVGTVKDANPIAAKSVTSTDASIQAYPGIDSVKFVSNNKIDVFFPQIPTDGDKIAYVIRFGGQQIPLYVHADTVKPLYNGLLRYTVTGLQTDTKYDFSVQARNIVTATESTNNATKGIKTVSNVTANFDGITQVRNRPGADGLNGVEVFWSEAETRGGNINKDPIDPFEYKITVINGGVVGGGPNANALTPASMNDTAFVDPDRKVITVASSKRSAIVNGLQPNTNYFFQVRAVHFGKTTALNAGNVSYLVEQNTKYREIATYSDNIANLKFDINSLETSYPSGASGLFAAQVSWTPPVGNFDHYRVFYIPEDEDPTLYFEDFLNNGKFNPFCFGPEIQDPQNIKIRCEQVESDKISRLITSLSANRSYKIALAVCMTSDCAQFSLDGDNLRLISTIRMHETTPAIANFSGITTLSGPKSLTDLDKVYLNYNSIDFSSGNISGLIVEYHGPTESIAPVQLNQFGDILDSNGVKVTVLENTNGTGLTVNDFDYLTDSSISISGTDPTLSQTYCFRIYPFTYDYVNNAKVPYKNGLTVKCVTPEIKGPTAVIFPGFDKVDCSPTLNAEKYVDLDWLKPEIGIFDKYEIYYAKGVTKPQFSYTSAITISDPDYPKYKRIILDDHIDSIRITDLEPNTTYTFGIRTRYQSINGIERSEVNTKYDSCIFGN